MIYAIRGLIPFIFDYFKFIKQASKSSNKFNKILIYPSLQDKYFDSGTSSGHYFHQDLIVAKSIFINKPLKHVDIGSRVDGFVAHVASFREIEVLDIRPLKSQVQSIKFRQFDIMQDLPEDLIEYCDSLSCLHTLEHFGLGRYGDEVNYDGYLKGFNNLTKILKKKGTLYLSVPIGREEIQFNSHRIFSLNKIIEMFKNDFTLNKFHYVDDNGDLEINVNINSEKVKNISNWNYGCGIFEIKKI